MKKRIAILAVITASFLLTACEQHETEMAQQGAEARLIVVDDSMSHIGFMPIKKRKSCI